MEGPTTDPLAAALARRRPVFGLWISIPDPLSIETVARAGYDFAILDAQHGAITWDSMLAAIQVLDLHRVPALVRVESNDPARIMRALDLGARGVVVPMVDTPEQALDAARACRYPPHGNRSFGQVRSFYSAAGGDSPGPLCLVMIETTEAMDNLEAIAATPGVDGLFVGPVDLALSMGFGAAEALKIPASVGEAIDRVRATCEAKGLIPGCPAFSREHARDLLARGMQLLPLGADIGLLRRAAAAEIAEARSWIGDAS